MSLDSIFRLSLIMGMVDNLTGPMARVQSSVGGSVSKIESASAAFGGMTAAGAAVATAGEAITSAVLSPVKATFGTLKALGELKAMGVKDLNTLEQAARDFSDTWAGQTAADFLTAAIDIKGGIDSLTEEGIAKYTEIAGITSKATGSTIDEMTSLFATGYGIYKDYYSDLSDIQFAEIFSSGMAQAILTFKASGSSMAQSITSLGGSATTANVPLEEQLAILGMLQATMSGSEAGTKYRAFLREAVKAGDELKLSFVDADNQLRSMPEILDLLKSKYGDTLDAMEKQQIQDAFGSDMAVGLIDLLYSKTGDLQSNILTLYDTMGKGMDVTLKMASIKNDTEPAQYEILQQQIQNTKEAIGNTLLPTMNDMLGKGREILEKTREWVSQNPRLVATLMQIALILGLVLTVGGAFIGVIGGIGLIFTKSAGYIGGFIKAVRSLPGLFTTIRLRAMYAGDGIKKGFGAIKTFGASAVTGIKNVAVSIGGMAKTAAISGATALRNMAVGLVGMARQAIITAATAMPGLIASVWGFTAALLANPVTWVVIGIIALIAGIVLLWNKCEWFRNGVTAVFGFLKDKIGAFFGFFKNVFQGIGSVAGKVMGALKSTVTEKLGNIKNAYEQHGGGIKGIAAAAIEGVKGIFTGGLSFIDNLTGGKLTAVKDKFVEKFQGIRDGVSNFMESAKSVASEKLSNMRAAYEQHGGGIKGAAAATMEGVKGAFSAGFGFLDSLTGGRLTSIKDKFTQGLSSMKNAITERFTAFKESGKKLIETFGEGIKSAFTAAVDAVKNGLGFIRELLPFSDAKEGPLSTLTLSGQRMMTTIAEGVALESDAPAAAVERGFDKIDAGREPVEKVSFREIYHEDERTERKAEGERPIIIQKLVLPVDLRTIKDLQHLFKILKEVEDYVMSNDMEPVPEGV